MEQKESSHEFQALIDPDGKIDVPSELVKLFSGRKLHVRLSSEEIVSELTDRQKDFAGISGLIIIPMKLIESGISGEEILRTVQR